MQFFVPLAVALSVLPSHAQPPPIAWPDTYVGRLEALAVVETLNVELLSSRGATLTLEKWCRDHRMAEKPAIVASLVQIEPKAPTAEQRERLQVTADALA